MTRLYKEDQNWRTDAYGKLFIYEEEAVLTIEDNWDSTHALEALMSIATEEGWFRQCDCVHEGWRIWYVLPNNEVNVYYASARSIADALDKARKHVKTGVMS